MGCVAICFFCDAQSNELCTEILVYDQRPKKVNMESTNRKYSTIFDLRTLVFIRLGGTSVRWLWRLRKHVFTARCTLVQSAVLRSHVVCLSVRPSVTLVNCDHIGWNSSKIISRSVSLGCSLFATQTSRVYSKGNTPKFSPE